MSDEIARMLYEGALAVTQGRHAAAQELLMKVLEIDEQNEQAWLWLSGAVEDPADQQVALENVLALNPQNRATPGGLTLPSAASCPGGGSNRCPARRWQPPAPLGDDEVSELHCWQCHASLYSVAEYCWQCHSPIHACYNCNFRGEARCKQLQGLTSDLLQAGRNECPWWRPSPV